MEKLLNREFKSSKTVAAEFNNVVLIYNWLEEREVQCEFCTWQEIFGGTTGKDKPCVLFKTNGKLFLIAYFTLVRSYKLFEVATKIVVLGDDTGFYNFENFTSHLI